MKAFYLVLAILGILIPYAFFLPFIAENGLDISLLFEQVFATPISAFFAVDVFLSVFVLIFFILTEGKRQEMQNLWIYILCTLLVGVSFALPLFLFIREDGLKTQKKRKRKKHANPA